MIGEVTLYTDGRIEWHPEDTTEVLVSRELFEQVVNLWNASKRVRKLHTANKYGECTTCNFVKHPCPTIKELDGEPKNEN